MSTTPTASPPWKLWPGERSQFIFNEDATTPIHPQKKTFPTHQRFLTDKYGDRKCLGTRETLAETEESQGGGKVLKKLILAEEYRWNTYEDLGRDSELFARGLMEVGVENRICILILILISRRWAGAVIGYRLSTTRT